MTWSLMSLPFSIFTIHYGEIKTVFNGSDSKKTHIFTIHYGEIKTDLVAVLPCPVVLIYNPLW